MNLRWYQTYDRCGLDSEETLQFFDIEIGDWCDVPFVRERETDYEKENSQTIS